MSLTYTATAAAAVGLGGYVINYTATGVAIGTASADRIVVVALQLDSAIQTTLPTLTIGGTTANLLGEGNNATGWGQAVWYLNVPTGTTATFVFSWTDAASRTLCYSVAAISGQNGGAAAVPTFGNSYGVNQASPISKTVTVPTGGLAVCFASTPAATSATPVFAWTGTTVAAGDESVANLSLAPGTELTMAQATGASLVGSTGNDTVTCACTTGNTLGFSGTIAWAAFAPSAGVAFQLGTTVQTNGINAFALANKIHILSAAPATPAYSDISGTTLGNMNFGIGNCFGAPADNAGPPANMRLTSVAVTAGSVTANGTPTCWAVADDANSRLLAWGPLSGGVAVTSGESWTLASFIIQVPVQ